MEQWEGLIEACPSPVDLRFFTKAVQTAAVVLKEDLAHFELEWMFQTLLHKPLDLLSVVSTKRTDDAWSKVLGDTFKLLAEAVDRHQAELEKHFENIVQLCVLNFDAQTRNQALHCLTNIARVSPVGATHAGRLVASLEESTTGKAPLALLVGTICEYHPEIVENDINKIWRIYLNLLDCTKNTDTVKCALLRGILGVLKHFGSDLPTIELSAFYDKLAANYITNPRCEQVCVQILRGHCGLFVERVSKDARTRRAVWAAGGSDVIEALRAIYQHTGRWASREQLMQIATSELIPQAQSHRPSVKYTALRILAQWRAQCGVNVEIGPQVDAYSLEFELRQENVSVEVAEAVSWSIESGVFGSESLLQTAMASYTHLPASLRKRVVVYNLLNAHNTVRTASTIFLIAESTQSEESLETHMSIWEDIFDTDSGKDAVVLEKSRCVFEDFMGYLIFVLEEVLEQGVEGDTTRLCALLRLSARVLTWQRDPCGEHCLLLLPLLTSLLKLQPHAAVACAGRCVCAHIDASHCDLLRDFYQVVRIESCKDEALLCEWCLTLVEAGAGTNDGDTLMALQITFSRNDAEPQLLSKALAKLEIIIANEKQHLDSKIFNNILQHVQRIYNRKDMTGKYARILRRDILMFLGKYGCELEFNNNVSNANIPIVRLMDTLTLNVPNPEEGTTYKINLQKLLHRALEHEESSSLQILLTILSANYPSTQEALSLVCVGLSRAHARGSSLDPRAIQAALCMCDSPDTVQGILQCIGSERSPGVRKMLSDGLEALLVRDREDLLISSVAEQAAALMTSPHATKKRAGLNITETLVTALKEFNSLTKNLLPELMVLVTRTFQTDSDTTFNASSKLFMDKIELFENSEVDKLLKGLLEVLLIKEVKQNTTLNEMAVKRNKMAESEVKIFKITAKIVLEFIKSVIDYNKEDTKKISTMIFELFRNDDYDIEKSLFILAHFKIVFGYNSDIESDFVNRLFFMESAMEEPYFCTEAVLIFLQEYADMLLQLYYQETLQFLSKLIPELSPQCIKYLHKNMKSCLSVYTKKKIPTALQRSLETWFSKQPASEITKNVEKETFITADSVTVFSLKIMLRFVDKNALTDLSNITKKWSKVLLKLFSNGHIANYYKSKMSYLTDILEISITFLKTTDLKNIILEGSSLHEKIGIEFCRYFMHVFYEVLLKKPYILMDSDMSKCCVLLNDIVKFTVKKRCTDDQYDTVLELVDELWPVYENKANFIQKHSLLLDLSNFPKKLGAESNPLRWAFHNIVYSEATTEDKARLIAVLPGGEEYAPAYRSFASLLPTRLSEMRGASLCGLRTLLDALARTGDETLLQIVSTLASGEESPGWWDEAIDSCMRSLADVIVPDSLSRSHTRAAHKVLLPLLRYSSPSVVEKFFSAILGELLNPKDQPVTSAVRSYHKSLLDHTKMFNLLQLAIEKVPQSSLESPNSTLYENLTPKTTQSWCLIRKVCGLCSRLRKKPLPDAADGKLKEDYRKFQCANYNCFVAALCCMRPDAAWFGKHLYDVTAWDLLMDHGREYKLWIRPQWERGSRVLAGWVRGEAGGGARGCMRTERSRVFLRTLSESPLMYDLLTPAQQDTQSTTQDIELPANELNSHECAGTLTTLLQYSAAALDTSAWVQPLEAGLQRCSANTRWLIARVICNCKEELQPHASALRPALLEMVAATPIERDGMKILNGLHIDILETILEWGDDSPAPCPALDATLVLLLSTARRHQPRKQIYKTIVDVIVKILDRYGGVVHVQEELYEPLVSDNDIPKSLLVHIPSALPTLLTRLEGKQMYQLAKLAEVVGVLLNKSRNRQQYLNRFRKVLDAARASNGANFVRMLYYAQAGCEACCDEHNFRMVTNLAQKLVGQDKAKCLRILTTFVRSSTSEYIQEMYETVDLPELMAQGTVEAFELVAEGVKMMCWEVKKRLVLVAAKYCDHSLAKVRRAAASVMLKAFQDLLTTPDEPANKKAKLSTNRLISLLLSDDVYSGAVTRALGCACADGDDVSKGGVAELLDHDMATRFVESFLLAVYLPSLSGSAQSLCESVTAVLDMTLHQLRSQERFKRILLRDEPLQARSSSTSCKLLTMSRTYQGSFRRTAFTNRTSPRITAANDSSPDINVQISIDHILDTFLRFAKEVPEVSEVLCLDLVEALKPGSDLSAHMASALAAILDRGVNELTPFVVQICRVFVDDLCKVDGIQDTIRRLEDTTRNTEGEGILRLLSQEVKLRIQGPGQFVMGTAGYEPDVAMGDASFTIEGLTSAFGSLSNWDCLTIQQKDRVYNSLPPLWTDHDHFKQLFYSYTGRSDWFGKMCAAVRGEGCGEGVRWLTHTARYPRTTTHNAHVVEALSMLEGRLDAICRIRHTHCLAEWAARLMLRKVYEDSLPSSDGCEDRGLLSRSHELKWCEIANEMELGANVLKCVKRNTPSLSAPSEPLPWLLATVSARRCVALRGDARDQLERASQALRAHGARYAAHANDKHVYELARVTMMLNNDLKSLSKENIEECFKLVQSVGSGNDLGNNKRTLQSICELAMAHYDQLWDSEAATEPQQNSLISSMTDVLRRSVNLGTFDESLLAVPLSRLDQCGGVLQQQVADDLLEQIHTNLQSIDDFSISYALSSNVFPSRSLATYPLTSASENEAIEKYKRCLQLLCDPGHVLLQYCSELRNALNRGDEDEWDSVFERMKDKLFLNPYAGSDYQLLNRHKTRLLEIQEYDMSPTWRAAAERVLKDLGRQLASLPPRKELITSQLCPALGDMGACPPRLLGLTTEVPVRMHAQVLVLSSVRRPVVCRILLSDGRTRRYIVKSGEPARADAAAMRTIRATADTHNLTHYKVTPLSCDCGLIEFLEDHDTLRSLIGEELLDATLASTLRPPDQELLLSPLPPLVSQFHGACAALPPHCLRAALSRRALTERDRIRIADAFTRSLAATTVYTWVLGLGDRHLENIMCSADGRLCHIDWGGALRFGPELPPARLTRNMLALCDHTVLEARLQQHLSSLRERHQIFSAVLKISFKWMGEPFSAVYPYIKSLVAGAALSRDVTRAVVEQCSPSPARDKTLDILELALQDFPNKPLYTVEQQISCLLRHSTDPRILSVTRALWEPWV